MTYLVRVLALALTTSPTVAQSNFTVTGPSSLPFVSYDIDGQQNPTLTVVRGQTYTFTLVNCAFHPFRIQSTSGFGGTLYANVVNNGGTSGTVTLTVPIDEPAPSLYYQCGNHPAMSGAITVVDPPAVSTPTPPPTPTPTPTPTPLPSVGCNGSSEIAIDDLLTMVNIALGNASLSTCPEGDRNGDNRITVDELLRSVACALAGCGQWDY